MITKTKIYKIVNVNAKGKADLRMRNIKKIFINLNNLFCRFA